jgi:hypothetical protein
VAALVEEVEVEVELVRVEPVAFDYFERYQAFLIVEAL